MNRIRALKPDSTPRSSAEVAVLFGELYRELHRVAARQLRRSGGSTLGATTLLHEAYLDLAEGRCGFPDEKRFIAYAARAMRGLVIDHIRQRRAIKRGGEFHLTRLTTEIADQVPAGPDMERLSAALDELEQVEPELARLVDLKFFCGFSLSDIAVQRGVSERTVQRDWQKAKLFLHDALHED